ncbi:hypothetical protein Tco_0698219, partial [Tanacetum coccineum]
SLGKTVNELYAMLKLYEKTLNLSKNNAPALHAIRAVQQTATIKGCQGTKSREWEK